MYEFVEVLRNLQSLFHKSFMPIVKELGFSSTEIIVLLKVLKSGFFRPTEQAKSMDIPTSTFTGIVDRLVAKGYLQREADPNDRRSIVVKGTAMFYDKAAEVQKACDDRMVDVFRNVPPELLAETQRGLEQIYAQIMEENRDNETGCNMKSDEGGNSL